MQTESASELLMFLIYKIKNFPSAINAGRHI